jgi:hypothetical protein
MTLRFGGFPKGTVRVRIAIRTRRVRTEHGHMRDARTVVDRRTYRLCA